MAKSSRADGRHRCEIFIMRNRRSASKNEKAQVWDVTNKDIDLINRGKIFTRANRSGMPKDLSKQGDYQSSQIVMVGSCSSRPLFSCEEG